MTTIKNQNCQERLKRQHFSDRWNYGLTKYRKTNKFQPKEDSVSY